MEGPRDEEDKALLQQRCIAIKEKPLRLEELELKFGRTGNVEAAMRHEIGTAIAQLRHQHSTAHDINEASEMKAHAEDLEQDLDELINEYNALKQQLPALIKEKKQLIRTHSK